MMRMGGQNLQEGARQRHLIEMSGCAARSSPSESGAHGWRCSCSFAERGDRASWWPHRQRLPSSPCSVAIRAFSEPKRLWLKAPVVAGRPGSSA